MHGQSTEVIERFDDYIPDFIESELEQLYCGRFANAEYFRIDGGLEGVGAYRVARGDAPVVVLLYRRDRGKLWVLNQAIAIPRAEVERFAAHMFSAFPELRRIDFHAIATEATGLSYPSLALQSREDTVAELPGTVEEYEASLGKSTRHNLRRYGARLKRDHPDFRFSVVPREQIGAEHLQMLQRLNRERLQDKRRPSTLDDAEMRKLRQLAARYGLVTLATIGGDAVGGMLSFVVGDGISFRIIAHDPSYDDYSLGFLIYFMTICEAIRLGCRQMNFGWDYYPYKIRLGGRSRPLMTLSVYRSRLAYALDAVGILMRSIAHGRQHLALSVRRASLSGVRSARVLHALAGKLRRAFGRKMVSP